MCGLVGIIGPCEIPHIHMFRFMLAFDVVRGEDSTGVAFKKVFTGSRKPEVYLAKAEGIPYNLYRRNPELFENNGVVRKAVTERIDFLMGHNRSATIGGQSRMNAHPFAHKHIIGCHNGTISTGLHNLTVVKNELKGETDSEKIFNALSNGQSLDEIMSKLNGAAALTWFDMRDNTFHIYRNKERPLHYVESHIGDNVAYASEPWMLEQAIAKSKASFKKEIKELAVNTHIKFTLAPLTGRVTGQELSEVATYTSPLVVTGTPKMKTTQSGGTKTNTAQYPVAKRPAFLDEEKKGGGNVIPFGKGSSPGWVSVNYDKFTFEEIAGCGCTLCSRHLSYFDYMQKKVYFMEPEVPVCSDCAIDIVYEGVTN